jgi:hypothetical protein
MAALLYSLGQGSQRSWLQITAFIVQSMRDVLEGASLGSETIDYTQFNPSLRMTNLKASILCRKLSSNI